MVTYACSSSNPVRKQISFALHDLLICDGEAEVRGYLSSHKGETYTYLILDEEKKPFYIGKGKGNRLFSHEKEEGGTSLKKAKITGIKCRGGKIYYAIDRFHETEQAALDRETALINHFGLTTEDGVLLNAQAYEAENLRDGVALVKYASRVDGFPFDVPKDFKYYDARLRIGPMQPKSATSVFGVIYDELARMPGITGAELVKILLERDWSHIKSKYVRDGKASAAWLCGYIEGGFYEKNRHVSLF